MIVTDDDGINVRQLFDRKRNAPISLFPKVRTVRVRSVDWSARFSEKWVTEDTDAVKLYEQRRMADPRHADVVAVGRSTERHQVVRTEFFDGKFYVKLLVRKK